MAPIAMPPSNATGNERRLPTTGAASADTRSVDACVACRLVIEPSGMTATPDRTPPAAQLTAAIRVLPQPSRVSAPGFSAMAEVASPNRVMTSAMAIRIRLSTPNRSPAAVTVRCVSRLPTTTESVP